VRFALMTEPQQGLSYTDILALAQAAEQAGFEAFFRSDHYTSFPGASGKPTTDAWTTLAGLARETSRIRLGTLVSPVTFRIPGSFAKVAMTVDEMSGGRVEVGLGAGWNTAEHASHGIPYPSDRERVDMLEEELQILVGLWDQPDGWSFEGGHWQIRDAHLRPKDRSTYASGNARTRPNLIVGGTGKPRTLRLAARYADEYNMSVASAEDCQDAFERLAGLCRDAGRDPSAVTRSVMVGTLIGRDDADLRDRTERLLPIIGETRAEADAKMGERQGRWLLGTPDQARAGLQRYADAGVERVMVQTLLPWDLDYVKVLADVFLG
jgi:F420-dependent oxidoreductase-like protein